MDELSRLCKTIFELWTIQPRSVDFQLAPAHPPKDLRHLHLRHYLRRRSCEQAVVAHGFSRPANRATGKEAGRQPVRGSETDGPAARSLVAARSPRAPGRLTHRPRGKGKGSTLVTNTKVASELMSDPASGKVSPRLRRVVAGDFLLSPP